MTFATYSEIRKKSPSVDEINSVCFRVTRGCNLACSYCQAPPNSKQQTLDSMINALTWLDKKGCKGVKFTGGEPTAIPHLTNLIEECARLEMVPTVVTNGTILSDCLLNCFIDNRVRVKISLHGFSATHNKLQGADVFKTVQKNMQRMLHEGIEVSIHTLLHHDSDLDVEHWIEYLIHQGCHKISFMPFISRGRGVLLGDELALTDEELLEHKENVGLYAEKYKYQIIVRWLDFLDKPYIVYETDGNIYIEYESEQKDVLVYNAIGDAKNHILRGESKAIFRDVK